MAATLNASGLVTSDGSTFYSYGANGIGSHAFCGRQGAPTTAIAYGSNYAGNASGTGNTLSLAAARTDLGTRVSIGYSGMSGTWKWLSAPVQAGDGCTTGYIAGIAVRVA